MWAEDHTTIAYEWIGELVYCEECIHYASGRNGMCQRTHTRMNADDYCSRGRAK